MAAYQGNSGDSIPVKIRLPPYFIHEIPNWPAICRLTEQQLRGVTLQYPFFPDTVPVDAGRRSYFVEYAIHVRIYAGIIFDCDIDLVAAVGSNFPVTTDIEHGIQIAESEFVAFRVALKVDLIVTDIDLEAPFIQTHTIPDETAVDRHQLIRLHRQVVDT